MRRTLTIVFALIVILCSATAQVIPNSPKHEVRAVWLTTIGGIDWPHSYAQSAQSIARQQAELRTLLDSYQKAGINTVLLQTRIRGTLIYPSQYEPWDGCLSGFPGKSPGYDALRFAIDECHRRGMELHAWVVTIPVGKWEGAGCKNLRKRFPQLIKKIGPDGYMNPESRTTATYLADLCEEITRNYDIDGIHLDYIRYPETWKITVSREQGRQYITGIVRAIHDKVKAVKPWVKMSCSPIGKFDDLSRYWSHGWNAYTKVCQDAQGWLRDGLMDALFPMMYFRNDQFFPFAIDWAEQSHGKIIAPGLGIYFLDPKEGNWRLEDVTREMSVLREYGMGHAFFRGKFLTDNTQGIYDFTTAFNRHPALVPPMTWANHQRPESPSQINITENRLTWKGTTPYYNIYSSRTWPVDVTKAENLIATRRMEQALTLPTDGRYFAVTGMDRYGNESKDAQSHQETQPMRHDVALLPCDGQRLQLPNSVHELDATHVAIETLQGTLVATKGFQGKTLNVANLPDGYYVLRSLGHKGVTHRLGFFKIDRKNLSGM